VDIDDKEDSDGCSDEEHYETDTKTYFLCHNSTTHAVCGLFNWEGHMKCKTWGWCVGVCQECTVKFSIIRLGQHSYLARAEA